MGASASKNRLSLDSKIQILKNTPFFIYLGDDLLKEFAQKFHFATHCKEGKTISIDYENVYIVARGELELKTVLPKTHGKVETRGFLCKKCPGDIIYQPQSQKLANEKLSTRKLETFVEKLQTVSCKDSLLLHINRKSLDKFLSKHKDLADPIDAIISSHIETLLSNIPFLRDIKETQLSVLASMCRYEALDKDEIVFDEKNPGDKLYILLNGEATVLAPRWVRKATIIQQSLEWGAERGDDKAVVVADIKSGEYFGETAMFVNINRTSTVKTKTKCLFVSVEKKTFENFCAVCPNIKDKMTTIMKERMLCKLSSLNIPFFVGIPAESLKSMSEMVEIHVTEDKEVIFSEGETGDRFYIIVYGQVNVQTQNNVIPTDNETNDTETTKAEEIIASRRRSILGSLNAGNYFGEMALVSDSPRSATVISTGKTILLSMGKESFHKIFASNENALAEFTLRVLGASSELKHLLSHSLGLSMFKNYLKRNLAEENVDFWSAIEEFRKSGDIDGDVEQPSDDNPTSSSSTTTNKSRMLERANEIYDTFCSEGASRQVNLPCSIRTKIESILKNSDNPDDDDNENQKQLNPNLFNDAQSEIYKLLVRDNYARFRRTPDFKEIFKCLGILLDTQQQQQS